MDVFGFTPLHFAATQGHLQIVKFLIEHLNCAQDDPSYFGTALTIAAKRGHHEIVEYLQTVLLVRSGMNFYKIYVATVTR